MFCLQAEDGIRELVRSRGLGDVYKRQTVPRCPRDEGTHQQVGRALPPVGGHDVHAAQARDGDRLPGGGGRPGVANQAADGLRAVAGEADQAVRAGQPPSPINL